MSDDAETAAEPSNFELTSYPPDDPPKRRGGGAPIGNQNAKGSRHPGIGGRPRKDGSPAQPRNPETRRVGPAPSRGPHGKFGSSAASRETQIAAVTQQLFGAHQIASLMSGLPELAISETEAAMLGEPLFDTLALLGLPVDLGKYMAPVSLLIAMGIVYGPRLQAIKRRRDAAPQATEPAQEHPQGNGNGILVVGLPGDAGTAGAY